MAARKKTIKKRKTKKKKNKAITRKVKSKKKTSKPVARKKVARLRTRTPKKSPSRAWRAPSVSERDSAEVQGLSKAELADSESVAELVEEGNIFEAGVVKGVEDAEASEGAEVRTHEVPEDDVPQEYLDKD
jgi:hypothetical protein